MWVKVAIQKITHENQVQLQIVDERLESGKSQLDTARLFNVLWTHGIGTNSIERWYHKILRLISYVPKFRLTNIFYDLVIIYFCTVFIYASILILELTNFSSY